MMARGKAREGDAVAIAVLHTVPIFRVFDVDKAKEFYLGFLGFTLDWEHRFDERAPVYMQVSRAGMTLHLSQHHGDCCPGATAFVRVKGLAEYHRGNHREALRAHAAGD